MTLNFEFQKRMLLNLIFVIVSNIICLNLFEIDWIKNKLDGSINKHDTREEITQKITSYFFLWIFVFIVIYSILILITYVSISMYLHIASNDITNGFSAGVKCIQNLFWKFQENRTLMYYWIILFCAILLNLLYLPYSTQFKPTNLSAGLDNETTSPILVLTNFYGFSIISITILCIILSQLGTMNWEKYTISAIILILYFVVNLWITDANLQKKYLRFISIIILPIVLFLFWIFFN